MSLPDGAEYWWPRKGGVHIPFTHIQGYDCGHFHVHESTLLTEIDCHACKRHLEENQVLKLQFQSNADKELLKRRNKSIAKCKKSYPNNPICECGYPMKKRANSQSFKWFWGCMDYPICKKTIPYVADLNNNTDKQNK